MRRLLILIMVLGLVVGSITVADAAKKKKKKKKAPKPVEATLFFHGTQPEGLMEYPDGLFKEMTPEEPSGSAKSMQLLNYGRGPNPDCAGNNLFPVWSGKVAGTIVGDIKVTFNIASTPTQLDVRVWPDIAATACNEEYPEPAASAVVDVPPGQNELEVVLEDVNFPAQAILMVQINPFFNIADTLMQPFLGRINYDGDTAKSSVTFQCIPPAGAKSCLL